MASIVAAIASGVAVPLTGVLPGAWRSAIGIWAGVALIAAALWAPQLSRQRTTARQPGSEVPVTGVSPWRSLLAREVAAFMALAAAGFYTVITWYPTVLHHAGVTEAAAGWLLFVYQILTVVMSLTVPLLLRRMADQRRVAAIASAITPLWILAMLAATQTGIALRAGRNAHLQTPRA